MTHRYLPITEDFPSSDAENKAVALTALQTKVLDLVSEEGETCGFSCWEQHAVLMGAVVAMTMHLAEDHHFHSAQEVMKNIGNMFHAARLGRTVDEMRELIAAAIPDPDVH